MWTRWWNEVGAERLPRKRVLMNNPETCTKGHQLQHVQRDQVVGWIKGWLVKGGEEEAEQVTRVNNAFKNGELFYCPTCNLPVIKRPKFPENRRPQAQIQDDEVNPPPHPEIVAANLARDEADQR